MCFWVATEVVVSKSSFEKWLFYKVPRWSYGKISRKLPLSSSFLVKLQGKSLQVYQQNKSFSYFSEILIEKFRTPCF